MPAADAPNQSSPIVVVISGPNGAGKSTSAARLLPEGLDISHFVNADVIAAGLSAHAPEEVALEAGRIMLERLDELAAQRQSFAFETTLSARTYARFLRRLQEEGYQVHLVFVWLDAPELAIKRVAERVRRGGHHVPDETVVRRYQRGLANFRTPYSGIADSWLLCDNSGESLRVVAGEDAGGSDGLWTGRLTMPSMRVNDSAAAVESPFTQRVIKLMQEAVTDAISDHHRLGYAVAIRREGALVWLMPDGSTRPCIPGEPPPDRQ